jgi:hypothetical protein
MANSTAHSDLSAPRPSPLASPPRAPPGDPTPIHQPLPLDLYLPPLPSAPATVAADPWRQSVFGVGGCGGGLAGAAPGCFVAAVVGAAPPGRRRRWRPPRPCRGGGGCGWPWIFGSRRDPSPLWLLAIRWGACAEPICPIRWSSIHLRVGEVRLPVKTELRLRSWRTMAPYTRRHLVEGIVQADLVFSLGPLQGNPRSF